jgi:ferric-dicitrate binding protein FerR (iron transport regulator)
MTTVYQNENENKNRVDKLLREYYKGDIPAPLLETLQGWLVSDDHSEEKAEALFSLFEENVWAQKKPDRNALRSLVEIHKRLGFPESRGMQISFTRRVAIRVAAVLIPIFFVADAYLLYNLVYKNDVDRKQQGVSAEVAKSLELPDGSAVLLTEGSGITYDESGRSVQLSGEAKFEVKKAQDASGATLPFTVATKNLKIDVLGTVFRVVDHDSSPASSISLYQGDVNVTCGTTHFGLRAGERLHYDRVANSAISIIPAQEMIDNGFKPLLRFEKSNRSNLFLSFEANYGVRFIVPEGIELEDGAASADFEGVSLADAVQALSLLDRLYNYHLSGDEITITEK